MDCPRCFSNVYVKSGSAKGKPRYKCKSCKLAAINIDNKSL